MAKQSNCRFLRCMGPVVEALQALGYSGRPKQVVQAVQAAVEAPPDDLQRTTKSGQSIFENDVHWCRAYLVKAGFIDSSKRGVWTLTPKGRTAEFDDHLTSEVFSIVQKQGRCTTQPVIISDSGAAELEEMQDEVDELNYRAEVQPGHFRERPESRPFAMGRHTSS